MRPMLSRLPWEHSSSSTCTCRIRSSPPSSLLSPPLPSHACRDVSARHYLRGRVRVGPQVHAHRRRAETSVGLLSLPHLCLLLHLLQLSLLVAVLQVLHQHRHDHIDQHELGSEDEGDKVNRRDQRKVGEAVAILRAALSQRVLGWPRLEKRAEIMQER